MKIKVWHKIVSLVCIAIVCGMANLFVIVAAEMGSAPTSCCCNPGDEAACSCDVSCKIHDLAVSDNFSQKPVIESSIVACGDVSDHALLLISLKYVPHIDGDEIYTKPYSLPTHYSFNFQPRYHTFPDKPPEFLLA